MQLNFMGKARLWLAISVLATLIGVAAMIYNQSSLGAPFNVGIDFLGGTLLEVRLPGEPTPGEVSATVAQQVTASPSVQKTDLPSYIIRTEYLTEGQRQSVLKGLTDQFGEPEVLSTSEISASVSSELTRNALIALAIAAVGQIIYIAFRFQWKFGITAVLASLHDVVVTMGLVALLRIEVNAAFIAAILTVVGYSMNDTIVVFDRIREELAAKNRPKNLNELVNLSINKTLRRTLLTSLTTLLALGFVIVFGGPSIRDFAVTMFIGIVVGTYSSICVASPLWVAWQKK